LMFRPDWLACR